jgi:hypothetical protein
VLKELFVAENSLGKKFGELNKRVQDMFLDWLPYENEIFCDKYIDPLDLDYLKAFQQGLETQHSSVELLQKLRMNMNVLEQVAAEMFRLVSTQVKGTPEDMKVNPYTMTLKGDIDSTSNEALPVNREIQKEVEKMWFYRKSLVNS